MTILNTPHQTLSVQTFSVAGPRTHRAAVAFVALCSVLATLLCTPLTAQPITPLTTPQARHESSPSHSLITGFEFSVLGSAMSASNHLANAPASTNLFLRAAHAGLHTMWSNGPLLADASLSLTSTYALGMRTTRPLGNVRVGTRRGRFSFSLGVEQTMGVAARGGQRTRGDTASIAPEDTLLTVPTPDQAIDQSNFSSATLVRASDVVGGLGWHTAFSTMHILAGLRASDLRNGAWAGLRGSVAVGASSALMFSVQHQARHTSIRTPAFTLGFRTFAWRWGNGAPHTTAATSRAATTDERALAPVRINITGDTLYLRIHLPTAQHVTVMGDATDWQSVELVYEDTGWWSIALRATDAMSRAQLRDDDGAWRPIPGLPTTHDEYSGGTISLLVPPPATATPPAR